MSRTESDVTATDDRWHLADVFLHLPVHLRSQRFWLTAASMLIALAIFVWFMVDYFYRRALPSTVLIATAGENSVYYDFGFDLRAGLAPYIANTALNVPTRGSRDNVRHLNSGLAQAAVVQAGSFEFEDLAVVSVLFPEVVHVLVRRELLPENRSDFRLANLNWNDVSVWGGEPGSGMRESAKDIVRQHAHGRL
jgi:TRAP-type uncharacterized transport system substrate-binding protein